MFIDYVNDLNDKIKYDSSTRINAFDPKINDSVITIYNVMEQYIKIEKKNLIPIPDRIKFRKKGNHSSTTFIFESSINIDSVDRAIESLKLDNVLVNADDNGYFNIEVEK